MIISKVIVCAVLLDLILGDPSWIPHPVVIIGKLIDKLEKRFRERIERKDLSIKAKSKALRRAGFLLNMIVCMLTLSVSTAACVVAWKISPWAFFALQIFWGFQTLAVKGLIKESKNVFSYLAPSARKSDAQRDDENNGIPRFESSENKNVDLDGARKAVVRIVGRDTSRLTAEGVTKATVETVAENFADGVMAPLLYLAIGGAPLALTYKAVNTMDSMLGYKNEKYIDFGRFSAKFDDVWGYVPARLAAFFFIAAAAVSGHDAKSAFKIWRRDRYNHASPNSAHTEAACAGALGIQLAGPAYYFGKYYDKPTIGDEKRKIEAGDILRANKLMLTASVLSAACFAAIRYLIFAALI